MQADKTKGVVENNPKWELVLTSSLVAWIAGPSQAIQMHMHIMQHCFLVFAFKYNTGPTAFLLKLLWWLRSPPTKTQPLIKQGLQGLAPASLATSRATLSPHHPPVSFHRSFCRFPPLCVPRLSFTWAPSSLPLSNSCLLSEWGACPLSSSPFWAWSYLSPYACSWLYCVCPFGCVIPTGLWNLPKVRDQVGFTFNQMPNASQLISAQCNIAEWLNINA